jgi:hypothetical protein
MTVRFWALLLLSLVTIGEEASSDLGPKPSIRFWFAADAGRFADDAGLFLMDGALLLCERADCADGKPLEPVGPQRFYCSLDGCQGLAYGFAPYLQLTLTLSDGRTLRSQVFEKREFDANYLMALQGDLLEVEECDQVCLEHRADKDVTRPPYVNFYFTDFPGPGIADGVLTICDRADCAGGTALPRHFFECHEAYCSGTTPGLSPYQQLTVTLSEGRTLRSQVFERRDFDAMYLMHIEGDALEVMLDRGGDQGASSAP